MHALKELSISKQVLLSTGKTSKQIRLFLNTLFIFCSFPNVSIVSNDQRDWLHTSVIARLCCGESQEFNKKYLSELRTLYKIAKINGNIPMFLGMVTHRRTHIDTHTCILALARYKQPHNKQTKVKVSEAVCH